MTLCWSSQQTRPMTYWDGDAMLAPEANREQRSVMGIVSL